VKRPVFWSRDALEEVKKIGRFIAKDDATAARKVATALRTAGDKLGVRATGRKGRVSGTYEKSVPRIPYIIAYALQPLPAGGETVVILRVIHGARNWLDESWPEE
jgi:plasmid stabilization system protein ParE